MNRIKITQAGFVKLTKRSLLTGLMVVLVFTGSGLIYLFGPLTKTTEAAWFNNSWRYRQAVTVTNNSGTQSSIQVALTIGTGNLITSGKMNSDCSDIRVADISGTVYTHWLEFCGTGSGNSSVIWATVPTLNVGNTTLYVYYGNSGASTTSSFSSVPTGVNGGSGNDGSITISGAKNINTDTMIAGRSCADGGDAVNYSVTANTSSGQATVVLSSTPSSGCLTAGDEVLIINLQGASGNTSDTGKYEFARMNSISTATLTLNRNLTNSYDGTTQKIMVQRVPNYAGLTVNSGISFSNAAWNGTKNGVMALRVSGTATITGNIDASSTGYRGGTSLSNGCAPEQQGESYGGVGGAGSQSANLGGGGAGFEENCPGNWAGAGAGGGYGAAGSNGIDGSSGGVSGTGGSTYGSAGLSQIYFGSAGGAGGSFGAGGGVGGVGGGIIFVQASNLTVTGTIKANGAAGSIPCAQGSGSGGGAGGSVYIQSGTTVLGSSLVTTSAGGQNSPCGAFFGFRGTGGAGGVGRIVTNYSTVSGSTSPAATTSTLPASSSPATEEVQAAPILYYRFDEGFGTTANDSSTSNAAGVLAGATKPTWQADDQCISGKCLYFNGSTAKVTTANTVSGLKTVQFWVKPTSTTGYFVDMDGTKQISASSGTISSTFTSPSIYVNGVAGTTLTANQWNFITVTTATAVNASALVLGNISSNYLTGNMDEVKMYTYVRSSAQIMADYNSLKNPQGVSAQFAKNQTNSPGALSNGLVGYYKMDETATPSVDSSGNGNSGTWNNNVAATAGKFGNGAVFDGNADYISVADSSSLDISSEITIASWINITLFTVASDHRIVSKTYGSNVNYRTSVREEAAGVLEPEFGYVDSGSTEHKWRATSTAFSASTWVHMVTTYKFGDANSLKIYINGKQIAGSWISGTGNGTAATNNNALVISSSGGLTDSFKGSMDEVRLYNRVLSGADANTLYNFAPGPSAYWNFEEATGTTANDSTGNAFTGTWSGSSNHWVAGKYGGAGNFSNANSDYIDASNLGNYPVGTFEMWVNPSSLPASGTDSILQTFKENGSSEPFSTDDKEIFINSSGNIKFRIFDGGNKFATTTTALKVGTWYHIAAITDGSNIKIYVNGALEATTSAGASFTFTQADLRIAGTVNGLGDGESAINRFSGKLDEIRFYKYARTSAQITEDMNAGHPAPGSPISSAVGYWKLDEGYGTGAGNAHNSGSGGNTLDGTLAGTAPTWSNSGKFLKALSFGGAGYIDIPTNPSSLQITDNLTISAWVNLTTNSAKHDIVSKIGTAATNVGYTMYTDSSGKLNFAVSGDGTSGNTKTITGATTLSTSTWYHVVGVYIPSTSLTIYVNAVQDGQNTTSIPASIFNSTNDLNIGAENSAGSATNFMSGLIDEVKIYHSSLTSAQTALDMNHSSGESLGAVGTNSGGIIADNSNAQSYLPPGNTNSSNAPVGEWLFEEGTGSTAQDTSGGGNSGTLTSNAVRIVGKVGNGMSFNGGTDSVTVANTISTKSVQFWVKPSSTTTDLIDLRTASTVTNISASSGTVSATGFTSPSIYVNGVLSGTITANVWNHIEVTTGTTVTANAIKFGRIGSNTPMTGIIDQVRFYDYARTQAEVAWDYNRGAPLAYWKLDECGGSTLGDSSGNAISGTLTVGATGSQTSAGTCSTSGTAWGNGVTGKFNYSLSFDGTDDYASFSNESRFEGMGSFTISAWIKTPGSNPSSTNRVVYGKDDVNTQRSFGLIALTTGAYYFFVFGNNNDFSDRNTTSTSLNDGNWHHFVATWTNGSAPSIYIDTKLNNGSSSQNNATGVVKNTTSSVTIGGAEAGAATRFYNGTFDEVRFYNYALTTTQINQIYNTGAVRFGPVTGAP